MGFGSRFAMVSCLLALLGLAEKADANLIFNSIFNPRDHYVTLEGRGNFYDEITHQRRWFEDGKDNFGIFTEDGICIGSTDEVSKIWPSHYDGLDINTDFYNKMLTGELKYEVKAWNAETGTIWDTKVMGTRLSDKGLDVMAFNDTGVTPEPATLALMGAGAYIVARDRKKSKK